MEFRMVIEPNKNYVTADGYIVQLGESRWSKNQIPLVNERGQDCIGTALWNEDGTISHFFGAPCSAMTEKLKIVAEFTDPIPQLPEGYKWKGGFMKLSLPKKGDEYIRREFGTYLIALSDHKQYPLLRYGHFVIEEIKKSKDPDPPSKENKMILESNHNYLTQGGYVVQFGDSLWSKNNVPYITKSGLNLTNGPVKSIGFWCLDGTFPGVTQEWAEKLKIIQEFTLPIPQLPEGYRWKDNFIQYRLPLEGEQYIAGFSKHTVTEYDLDVAHRNYQLHSYFIVEKIEKEEEIMKVNPVVAKSASVTFWAVKKLTNYFFVETAVNIARPIVKSVRYAIFLSVLGGVGYGYYHPEVVKNFVKSCIPKITIEAPEILKDAPSEV